MNIDASESMYHEAESAKHEFDRFELRRLRLLLRRLRFLETQIRKNGGLKNGDNSGGAAFTEWEIEALEWVLTEMDYLEEVQR